MAYLQGLYWKVHERERFLGEVEVFYVLGMMGI
jgi:hypothetical protein